MEFYSLCIITSLFLCFLLIYKYLTRNNGYWKSRGIPEARGAVLGFGHVLDQILLRKNMGMMTDVFYKANPKDSMVGIYAMQTPALVVRHPDLIKFVLSSGFAYFSDNTTLDKKADPLLFHDPFFQNGQAWKDSRAIFLSAFSAKKLKDRIPPINESCEILMTYLKDKAAKTPSMELEAKDLFSMYTLEVAARSILGINGQAFAATTEPQSLRAILNAVFVASTDTGFKQNLLLSVPALGQFFATGFAPEWVNTLYTKIVNDVKSMRANDKVPRSDILQHILDCMKEKGMDADELAGHTFGFLIEQYETSSITLSLMAYFAAKYPKIQDKMRAEVKDVLKKFGNINSYDAISSMTYLEQVAKECLRLYAALGRMVRLCSKTVTLEGPDGLSCTLNPGDEVHIPVSGLHMDSLYWDNPEEFNPERFSKENEERRHKFVYLAFGEGQRLCPGMRMGMLQVRAGMAAVLMNYVIERSDKVQEPLKLDPRYFMVSIQGGLWVRLTPRS